jgi:SnoaL-like domain
MPARTAVVILLASLSFMTTMTSNPAHAQTDAKNLRHSPERTLPASCGPLEHMSSAQFELLLQTVRDAWLQGNQEKATGCFASAAVFSIPPSPGLVGRESLLQVFGGGHNVEPPKRIEWHHVVFDTAQQVGAVEYTIERRVPTHGVVIIKISRGLISNWRQYAIASDLTWEKFQGMNNF